jgi:4-amino-4-deoxy-L-arabinose transferase-like glycosyltransferase
MDVNNDQARWLKRFAARPGLEWGLELLGLAVICGVAFWWTLGSIGLIDETEPLFAEAARQMNVTGDWITPYFNGQTRFDKPPLIYWLMAIAYQLIGVNEWAVRLPSALSATVLVVLVFYTLKRFGSPSLRSRQPDLAQQRRTAWIGAMLTALNLPTVLVARFGAADMLLSCCLGAALLSFFWAYTQASPAQSRYYLAFYFFSALAVLAKGPVGMVLPVLIIISFLVYVGQLRTVLREMHLLLGSCIFLITAVPWYILVIQANGQAFIQSFFKYHNFDRFTQVVNNHFAPWYFYFLVIPLGFFICSFYLPLAMIRLQFWQRRLWQRQSRGDHLGIFALIWLIVVFLFFTIARTKLFHYILPLTPAVAILVASLWSEQLNQRFVNRSIHLANLINVSFSLILSGVILYSLNWLRLIRDPAMPNLAQVIQRSGAIGWGAGIWYGAALLGLGLILYRQGRWVWVVNLAGFVLFILLSLLPAAHWIDADRQLPLRQLAATIVQLRQPDDAVVMVGPSKPSLVFYTQQPVRYWTNPEEVKPWMQTLRKQHSEIKRLLVVGYPTKIQDIQLQPDQYQLLQQSGAYQLIQVVLQSHDPIRVSSN